MNIRYPIYEGVYRILTLLVGGHHEKRDKYTFYAYRKKEDL